MKHFPLITFLLINLITLPHLTAMDQEEGIPLQPIYHDPHQTNKKTNTPPKKAPPLIGFIDQEIKKQIIPSTDFWQKQLPLTNIQQCDLLKIVGKHKNITPEEIKKLMDKNNLFKETIVYFCELAKKNINNVSCATLARVQNPAAWQPTSQLNQLSYTIKKYVMESATKDLVHSYDAVFEGHKTEVTCVDIHVPNDRAVSAGDDGIILWKFMNGKQLHCFPTQQTSPYRVRFDDTCSRLAVAEKEKHTQKELVRIWDIKSKTVLYTIPLQSCIRAMSFSAENNNELALFDLKYFLLLYELTKDATAVVQKQINMYMFDDGIHFACINPKNYSAPRVWNKKAWAWFTTNESHELYLYQCLLNNTPAESLSTMNSTSIYTNFDKRQRKIADALFTQRQEQQSTAPKTAGDKSQPQDDWLPSLWT